jgi:pimeloyl-ACP methyl ester carboxylesterase
MSTKRTAAIAAAVAGTVAVGAGVRVLVGRRHRANDEGSAIGDLPPEELAPVVSFDGTEIAVRVAGDPEAPLLLFTHGFSLDMSVWHEQWIELADDFRCVLMDHRSHGTSASGAHGDLSIRAMGRDIAAVLDAVARDRPVVVIGHSMGAMAIIAMAEQRPELFGERVVGVALIGASSSDLFRGAMGSVAEFLRLRLGTFATAARRVDRLRRAVLASPGDAGGVFARMTQFGPEAQPHLVDHIVGLAGRARPEVWTDGLAELMEMDLRHALPRVRVPAVVIVGRHDRITPPATAVVLVGVLPDANLVVVEDAGHMAMLERPAEVNHDIRVFARSCFQRAEHAVNGTVSRRRTAKKPTTEEPKGSASKAPKRSASKAPRKRAAAPTESSKGSTAPAPGETAP